MWMSINSRVINSENLKMEFQVLAKMHLIDDFPKLVLYVGKGGIRNTGHKDTCYYNVLLLYIFDLIFVSSASFIIIIL